MFSVSGQAPSALLASIAFSPHNPIFIASASNEGILTIWDIYTEKIILNTSLGAGIIQIDWNIFNAT